MSKALLPLFGMTVGLGALWILPSAWLALELPAGGVPVLLSHRCTQQELRSLGDGREIFVRYNPDHSSFVNNNLMPVENDLRRQIRTIMATRQEQVLYFTGDDSLSFGEVSKVLAELKADDPALWLVLLPKQQGNVSGRTPEYLSICLPKPWSLSLSQTLMLIAKPSGVGVCKTVFSVTSAVPHAHTSRVPTDRLREGVLVVDKPDFCFGFNTRVEQTKK
jgi:biopolymer transport protein ExbD